MAPNIIEYTSHSEITPSDKGIQAAEMAGRRIGQFYHQIGSSFKQVGDAVEQHMSVIEANELYKTGTELRINLQQRYEQESALPENRNNPHFGDQFMAEIGPLIDKWGQSASTDHGKQLAVSLGASIRNDIFSHVAAGQAEMDTAHVLDNAKQTGNLLGSGLITDPSESNLNRSIGTMKDTVDGMTMAIPDVGMRERVRTELLNTYLPQLVTTRYQGVAESIKNQIAETGAETSPALEQLNKDVTAQVGFQYITPETQSRLTGLGAQAVRQGQELFNSKNATAKAKMAEEGKAAYAELHSTITNLTLAGQPPTPELVAAIQNYAQKYGVSNPGEAASLDDYVVRIQGRAQQNAVQPFDQNVRDKIQTGFSYPTGDPRRPTKAGLLQAYSHGQITKEDLTGNTEILDKLDKPEKDPSFQPAWTALQRWQSIQLQGIGASQFGGKGPGAAAAQAAFIHDSTVNFMSWGRSSAGWDKALDHITNINNPTSFANVMKDVYSRAARETDANSWLQNNWYHFNADGTATPSSPARGSTVAPIVPTKNTPPKFTPAADLKKADEMLWGKH